MLQFMGLQSWTRLSSDGKVSACSAGDPGFIPGLGRSPGEGNSNPLQYSCLENPMVPWTEDLGGLQSMELQRLRTTEDEMAGWHH